MSSKIVNIANELVVASQEISHVTKKSSGLVTLDEMLINGQRYIVRVKIVRVSKLWKRSSGNFLEMVISDEKGNRIHATVEGESFKQYENILTKGNTITINTFDLQPNAGDYRTTNSPFKMSFFPTTRVRKYDNFPADVEEKYFKDLAIIKTGTLDPKELIDVIAQVTNVGPVEESNKNGRKSSRVTLDLRDHVKTTLKCTLFDSYAKQITAYADKHPDRQPVCVFRFVSLKEYKDIWSITNAYNSTELEIEEDTEFVRRFKSMLPKETFALTRNESSTLSFGSNISVYDEFITAKFTRATIDDIVTSTNVGICVTLAEVLSLGDCNKWYYIGCTCKRKVAPYPMDEEAVENKIRYKCPKCGDVEFVAPRYLITLNVTDDTGANAKFLLFDDVAEKLLDISAALLLEEVSKDDPGNLPNVISDLFGNKFLFKINIDEKNLKSSNAPYKVSLIGETQELITAFENERISSHTVSPLLITQGDGWSSDGTPRRVFSNDTNTEFSHGYSDGTPTPSSVTPKSRSRVGSSCDPNVVDKGSVTKKIKIEGDPKIGRQEDE